MLIDIYSQGGMAWLERHLGLKPLFACVLGFTQTAMIEGISAAGATPAARQLTAIADAEFLFTGRGTQYPLPDLVAGVSPVFISRALLTRLEIPIWLFDAGLPQALPVPHINLGGAIANCVSTGAALERKLVIHLFHQGLIWGERLASYAPYLVLGECVVGGTTTALGILTALGYQAKDRVNSSHRVCNHQQKWQIVSQGLAGHSSLTHDPIGAVAAVGDPCQIVLAGIAIAASRTVGVLLAGGTQMIAIYALAQALAQNLAHPWQPQNIAIGTTPWVAQDPNTIALATEVNVPLFAAKVSFAAAPYAQLRAYEQGFVKEGVGAGASMIAAILYQNWEQGQILAAIEQLVALHL
ncbi:MAG: TIGR00303 family protein [Pseudanabaenaceae cyanobacterium bins.68]|nr:TIGR00303 family protein [Pseudanabaenaceae cyanobacterium bins.68]